MYKMEGRDSSREAVEIMKKKITEERPGYSALTDSRSTVKEKTDTELNQGIKKTNKMNDSFPNIVVEVGRC